MKEMIDDKVYSTGITLLATCDNGYDVRHPLFTRTDLFRTDNGEYFLYTGGEDIEPITEEQAKEWVKQYASETYGEINLEVQILKALKGLYFKLIPTGVQDPKEVSRRNQESGKADCQHRGGPETLQGAQNQES